VCRKVKGDGVSGKLCMGGEVGGLGVREPGGRTIESQVFLKH